MPDLPPLSSAVPLSPRPQRAAMNRGDHHHHHGHHPHMGMGPGVPPPQHVHHARTHSGASVRRERGLSTSSIASGPPPSSGGSTVGPGTAGPRQMAFQREMHPPPHRDREMDRDVQMRDPHHHHHYQHHPSHSHHHPHPQQHHIHAPGPHASGLAAVAAAADAISSSIPGGIGPALVPTPGPGPHHEGQGVSGPGMAPPPAQSHPPPNGSSANGMQDANASTAPGNPPIASVNPSAPPNGIAATSSSRRAAPSQAPSLPSATLARIGRSLEVIRAEYDAAVGELGVVKGVKDEWEGKVMSQVAELNAIRKALYDLETAHGRIRDSYEAEIGKVKMELRVARQEQEQLEREREREQRDRVEREREQQARDQQQQQAVRAEQEREQREQREREQQQQRQVGLGMPPPHPAQQQQQHIQLGGPGQPPLVSQPPPPPPPPSQSLVQMGPPPVHASGTASGRTTPSVGAARRERESPRIPQMASQQQQPPSDREAPSVFYKPGPLERGMSRVPDERGSSDLRNPRDERGGPPEMRTPRDERGPPDLRNPRDERAPLTTDRERATTRGERDREREREEKARERAEERMRLERMQEREREREGGREYKRSRVGSGSGGGMGRPPGRQQQQMQVQHGQHQPEGSVGYYQQPPYLGHQQHPQQRPMGMGMGGPHQAHGPPVMQMQVQHGVPTPRFPPVPGTVNTGGIGLEAPPVSGPGTGPGEGSMEVDRDVDVDMRPPGDARPHPNPHPHPDEDMDVKRPGAGAGPSAGDSYYKNVNVREGTGPFPGMMDLGELPMELRMEGNDWWAVCNPRKAKRQVGGEVKRPVDVGLVHSLMHESVVCCVKFSADGKFLATGSNRSAQIYNTQSGQKMCTLVDEDAVTGKQGDLYIRSVCFSPCGRWLATGAEDKVVRIWDIAKQKIRSVFDGHQQEIYALEFSLDGRLLVSGSGDKTARVWDVSAILGSAATENGTSPSAVGDATRPTVLTIEDNATEKMPDLDVYADEEDERAVGEGGGDGRREREGGAVAAPGEEAMHVEGANGENGGPEAEPAADPGITSIAASPDGRFIAAGSLDSVIRLWDLRPLPPPPSSQLGVAGGAGPGSSSPGAQVKPKMIERLKGHKDSVYSVAFTRDGRFLVSASLDKGVRVWDVGHLGIVPWTGGAADAGPLLPLPSTQPGGEVGKRRKTRCVTQFVGHRDFVLSVAVSHDGRWVVSGSKDRGVMWWEVPSGGPEKREGGEESGEEGAMVGLGPKDAEAACVLQGHKNSVISIDLSPVGNLLATGSGDWQARIWTYETD